MRVHIPSARLGRSELKVTKIGLGLAALGRPAYINIGHADDLGVDRSVGAMELHAFDVLDAAWDAGVRYFDAARSYGRAEEFLASWLSARSISAADVAIGSKWGYRYTADWRVDVSEHEVKEHSLDMFRRQWAESRDLLGEHIDVYQIHSATLESGVLENREVLGALNDLAAGGIVIGLTTSGPQQAAIVLRALEIAEPNPFSCVQATWNPLETSAGPALSEAHDAGWGVIVKEAVANGRLTPRGDPPPRFREIAGQLGVGFDALAVAAAIAQTWSDVVLSGAVTPAQLMSNLGAVEISSGDGQSGGLADVAESPETYWATRSALPWN